MSRNIRKIRYVVLGALLFQFAALFAQRSDLTIKHLGAAVFNLVFRLCLKDCWVSSEIIEQLYNKNDYCRELGTVQLNPRFHSYNTRLRIHPRRCRARSEKNILKHFPKLDECKQGDLFSTFSMLSSSFGVSNLHIPTKSESQLKRPQI